MDSPYSTLSMAGKILIVDDSETDRAIYQRYLKKSNLAHYTILEGDCGDTGLCLCLHHQPDIILLDYLLPDFDGLEFLQALKVNVQSMPMVIVLTGQGNEQVAVEAMKMGAQDYLLKGNLDAEQLVRSIHRALTRQQLQHTIARNHRHQQLMANISLEISNSRDLASVLETVVQGSRQLLDCDRTLIYQFNPDLSGTVLAEAVLPGWTVSQGMKIADTCFQKQGIKRYLNGHKTVTSDIYKSSLTPCHIQLLESFQVQANIVVPILLREVANSERPRLWGLFIAHHCRAPREWQTDELELLDELAVQLAIAVQQRELISALRERAEVLTGVNRRLRHTTKTLKRRNQELDEFAYIASHDLKAPLRAIANLASWLKEDLAGSIPAENERHLDLMQSRVHRMEGFIEGLLQYSRAGRQSLDIVAVDTSELVAEIWATLPKPPEFHLVVPESMPTLQTQRLLLQQVMANLIGNAVKYHDRPDGQITVTVEEQHPHIVFAIADDGPGIDPQYHDRIFGVFQTLSSRDTVESTGIGLSIVKKIVEQQGGTVTVQSALGQGSTFSFSWPWQSEES